MRAFNLNPPALPSSVLNIPLEPPILRKMNQSRSRFDVAGEERTGRRQGGRMLKFREQAMPRLISSPFDEAASGRFWIEPVSGAVVRSELTISAPNVSCDNHRDLRASAQSCGLVARVDGRKLQAGQWDGGAQRPRLSTRTSDDFRSTS